MDKPFFSIIIPTFNRKDVISETINSALNQTFPTFDIIVVDDGSTDGTVEFLASEFGDKIKVISSPNGERGKARNTGTQHASGEYIYFLDSDDLLYPNHLEEAHQFIKSLNSPEWIFQEYEFKNASTGKAKSVTYDKANPVLDLVTNGNFLSCHGVFLRKDIAHQHPFEENRQMAGSEDYALWLELAARYPLNMNQKVTSALIQHPDRSVFNFAPEKLIRRKEIMLQKVLADPIITKEFSNLIPRLKSNTYSYIALHLVLMSEKKQAFEYLKKSICTHPVGIFKRRTLAILKHLLIK